MHIEKLDENQIRIFLDVFDLKEKNIDLHTFMSSPFETQNLISEILDIAELQVGFTPNDSALAVEALACLNGKFILTITKITPEGFSNNLASNSELLPSNPYIFVFNTFDDFCDFVNAYANTPCINLLNKSSLVFLDNIYYLIIDKSSLNSSCYKNFSSIISDFANFVSNENCLKDRLKEFGKVIF